MVLEVGVQKVAEFIKKAELIAVLTGAGISTESGIPDFRSNQGLWNTFTEHKLSTNYLRYDPRDFWSFYKELFALKTAEMYQPNDGHHFLVKLEELGKRVTVITQNIDGLHHKAGSTTVWEVHGNAKGAYCPSCMNPYPLDYIMKLELPVCTNEYCKEILKPNVVLFGDQVKHIDVSVEAVEQCDLFIVMGSSLKVSPINQLVEIARIQPNRKLVLVNGEPTTFDSLFDVVIHAPLGETVRKIWTYYHL